MDEQNILEKLLKECKVRRGSDGDNIKQVVHVVAVPYPAQGHIVPMMQLCRQIAGVLGPEGGMVTIVNTEHIHARMVQAAAVAAGAGHDEEEENIMNNNNNIRMVSIEGGLPPELHEVPEQAMAALLASEALLPPFLRLLHRLHGPTNPPVTHILSDVMLSWTQSPADALAIPRLAFWTSSASSLFPISLLFHHHAQAAAFPTSSSSFKAITDKRREEDGEKVTWVPGLPLMGIDDLPAVVQSEETCPVYQFLMRQLRPLQKASCILINTGYELEDQVLSALNALSATNPPVLAIGPLLPPTLTTKLALSTSNQHLTNTDFGSPHSHGGLGFHGQQYQRGIFDEDVGCLHWLHGQAPHSVLYISFGSLLRMQEEQFKELAAGLEESGTHFLWSIRPDFVEGGSYLDKLPPSFSECTKGRGIMISWVPQLDVLSHPSIGGFLTHCGWNSILESVCMGVPLLCWPSSGERRTNELLATAKWGIALDFASTSGTNGNKNAPMVIKKDVSNMIKKLMGSTSTSQTLRHKAHALRDAIILSLCPNSSRFHAFQLLLSHLQSNMKIPYLT